MPQRLDEEKSIKDLCQSALDVSDQVLSEFGSGVTSRQWKVFVDSIRELSTRDYRINELESAIKQIIVKMREDLLRIIAQENDIDQISIQVNQKIGEIREILASKIPSQHKYKIERIVQLLREIEPLVQREMDISSAMRHLETELRKLMRKLEKVD